METTLATRSYSELVKRAQEKGYKVTLLYFWLSSPELAVERVARRVSEGGHNIPKDVIYRRYEKGLKNLFDIFIPIVDSWMIVDNGVEPREVIAEGDINEINICCVEKFEKIK
ncbi:MAG: zeta toxin family protein, partial [Paludibacteraceae bacterium]|nr:zeta toxin family protein [Paludibacteraceae bacterium]